ncbi:MAG: flagellar motor stator protein MotA [Rhodospirillales bacterium]|jgi:chemotaxis protein MotA|nr:flagellar motor stator protein MotA [Rhodospirillaceae bacterium]MDP6427972.1 flagellar motor stator protein MotA [Rhodospirillales bacterium]MDP6646008.1 flagellar motor stator protein MotA [Rhodospirillales bacterium]MDP6841193.1 flagellar motor stator protein MotA [Rhodospirillales bacterium]|tara:strand:+ start:969 stop:1829 length:861 start_codon:yes stop_codon:yes gene_type:complete
MFFIIGFIVVFGSVVGGYLALGGHLDVLWQPFEFVIIGGAAIGQLLIASPKRVIGGLAGSFGVILKGSKYNKDSYLELLSVLYSVFRLAKSKGDLALETHVEKPDESTIFAKFPMFTSDHHAVEFLCDYLRLLTLGASTSHEVEAVMEQELETHHSEDHDVAHAMATMGDAFPALGIVAAVLGVIHTMGSITEPPEVLGHLIGGALVGTFFGILISYGLVSPMAKSLEAAFSADSKYMECIKTGIIAHMQGYAPQVSIEFARKVLGSDVRPSFAEVEEQIQNIPSD